MISTPFFSIIIPVYNVEHYLSQCIDSILFQNFTDFEIILVNDGSTDSSKKLCEAYVNKDKRVKLFNQKNGGLSSARNTGLKHAIGSYLWFVDSDDWISENALNKMNDVLNQNINLDVISFSHTNFNETTSKFSMPQNQESINTTDGNGFIEKSKNLFFSVWTYVYSKNFIKINQLWFLENQIHEDDYFNISSFGKIKKILKITDSLYFYRQREGSIMNNYSKYHLSKRIDSYIKLVNLCGEINNLNRFFLETQKGHYKHALFNVLNAFMYYETNFLKKTETLKKVKKAINKLPKGFKDELNKTSMSKFILWSFNTNVILYFLAKTIFDSYSKVRSS